jgi:hypothetical protein
MSDTKHDNEQRVRDRAYFIWEREGRPEGRARHHWYRAIREASRHEPDTDEDSLLEEEKVLAGRGDVNLPALLTRDVPGG